MIFFNFFFTSSLRLGTFDAFSKADVKLLLNVLSAFTVHSRRAIAYESTRHYSITVFSASTEHNKKYIGTFVLQGHMHAFGDGKEPAHRRPRKHKIIIVCLNLFGFHWPVLLYYC